ncbi:hypothetical protein RJT34_15482 [Clitoria ternatea]|uniref:(+)-neomenthol dehydrogenase n=1 Tax=Clitoria ternatea TaxID=43366 RepID=A0AAN9J6P7_CLITE
MGEEAKRCAVVTGANKGIGYGICKKLASHGILVVLTARNEERGLKAVENLKEFGLSDFVVFHQLDVTDPSSVASLASFIKTRFGKLDILVNNAGVPGGIVNGENLFKVNRREVFDWNLVVHQSYELAEECVEIGFFGTERVTEALLPLLQLSISPRIVNVSSRIGMLQNIPNEWARGVFGDIENLTNEKLGEVLREFLKDYKEGSLETKNWPPAVSGCTMAKAAVNGYTRMLAKKFPHFRINCLCPGFVKTDINQNFGLLSIDEGAENPVRLALLPDNAPSGLFYSKDENIPNGRPKEVLSDVGNLTEEMIDDIVNEFLKDFKEGTLGTKDWPIGMSAYSVSKAALNAYTRILAKKYPSFCINALCPGFVKTHMNHNTGYLTPDEGAVKLALLPSNSPSGLFYFQTEKGSF